MNVLSEDTEELMRKCFFNINALPTGARRIGNSFPEKLKDQNQWYSGDKIEEIKPFNNKEASQIKTSRVFLAVYSSIVKA